MPTLFDHVAQELRQATVIRNLSLEAIGEIEREWQTFRRSAGSLVASSDPQHAAWSWLDKFRDYARENVEFVGLTCGEQNQGLLAIKKQPKIFPLSFTQKPVLYIEYVETAPWNSSYYAIARRYSGVGTVLLECAIEISMVTECNGAIGLHSLGQAESFYRRSNFTDLGVDAEEGNLRYFEMPADKAVNFLKGA